MASVHDIGVDECFEPIRRAPLLESLRLEAINPSSIFPIPNTRVIPPHLHSLELLGIKEETVVTGILDSLCLPSLEQWISFIGYLSSRLKISIDEVDYHQVPGLLSPLPCLECLELRNAIKRLPTEELISLLCDSAESSLYLPHLQSLKFVCEFHFLWKSLPQIFARPRWQSLRVRVDPGLGLSVDDDIVELVVELVDKGFDFRLIKDGKDWLQEYLYLLLRVKNWRTQNLQNQSGTG